MIFTLILVLLMTVIPCSAQYQRPPQPPLVLDKSNGQAPLNVTIVAPSQFAARLSNYDGHWNNWGGAGFSVDWGDGITEPTRANHTGLRGGLARHTYTVPGTYSIKANTYHPGPLDEPVNEWFGTTTVTVTATANQGAPIKVMPRKK
jgi:hypothetical protein